MSCPEVREAVAQEVPEVGKSTLGTILRGWLPSVVGARNLGGRALRVLRQIADCGTAKLGLNLLRCRVCAASHWTPRSCGDRHCPRCLSGKSKQWLEKQTLSLVPVTYYHCVFTLPEELNALLLSNPQVLYPLLFRSASETLLEMGRNRLGGDLGITAVLHTWGQKLNYHPHLHCIVTGGALSADGKRWRAPKQRKFLFDVRAIGALFRGKFLAGLKEILAAEHKEALRLPEILRGAPTRQSRAWWNKLYETKWVVYSKQPFGGPAQVLSYLANYTHRVAISNRRIIAATAEHVTFSYRDYRDASKVKNLTLTVTQFVGRFCLHILPLGLVRIRHFGILANNRRKRDIAIVRELLARRPGPRRALPPAQPPPKPVTLPKCPGCGQEALVWMGFQDKYGAMHYRALPGRAIDSP